MKTPKGWRKIRTGEIITKYCKWFGDEFLGDLFKRVARPTKKGK